VDHAGERGGVGMEIFRYRSIIRYLVFLSDGMLVGCIFTWAGEAEIRLQLAFDKLSWSKMEWRTVEVCFHMRILRPSISLLILAFTAQQMAQVLCSCRKLICTIMYLRPNLFRHSLGRTEEASMVTVGR
jgi:hypothetical protein